MSRGNASCPRPEVARAPGRCRGTWPTTVLGVLAACLSLARPEVIAHAGDRPIRHRLVEGSVLVDDCPPCARPVVPLRLRGTFDLAEVASEPGVQRMELREIAWRAPSGDGATVTVSGRGLVTKRGDVLSTWGWVVYRNLELMEGFHPLEDLADFGLEGLFVLTDLAAVPEAGPVWWRRDGDAMVVEGVGKARAWQLEGTGALGGPFEVVGRPTPWAR